MKQNWIAIAIIIFTVSLLSCKSKSNANFTYEYKNLEFVFEPPYAGSDTKSAEVNLNLDSAFAANKADITKIDKVTLDKIQFSMDDGNNFDNFGGLTVEFQSDNADVKTITVGSVNEIAKGKKEVSFTGSEKKNADDFFKQKKFNILLSSNMSSGDSLLYKIKGILQFKVAAAIKK